MWPNYNPDLELDAFIAERVLGWQIITGSVANGSIRFSTDGTDGTPAQVLCTSNRDTEYSPTLYEIHLRFALARVSQFRRVDGVEYLDDQNEARATLRLHDGNVQGTGSTFLRAACDAIRRVYQS